MPGTIENHETRPLLTVEEAAARLRVSRPTMYRLANAEIVPALRVGGLIRFDAAELEEWLYSDVDGGSPGSPLVHDPAERDGLDGTPSPEGPSQLAGGSS